MTRRHTFQWLLLLVALCIYAWFAAWNVWPAINSNDFKHIFFGMQALLDGGSPYPIQSLHHQAALQGYRGMSFNPYVYLPFTGHAMGFLAPLHLDQAVAAWFILNHLFVAGSVYIISGMFPKWRIGAAAILVFSLAFSTPLYRTLTAGQLNLALLFLICLALRLLEKNKLAWCGAVIAFAALFKLMPGIYGLYFILRRQCRSMVAMVVSSFGLLLISFLMTGSRIYGEFLTVLQQMGYGRSTWPHVFSFWDDPPNQSLNSFFSHIFTENDHTTPWTAAGQSLANLATVVITGLLLMCYVWVIRRPLRGGSSSCFSIIDEGAWTATLILGLLIPSLLWDHYLVMLILPTAWIIRASLQLHRPLTASVGAVSYITTAIPWDFANESWRQGAGIFLMSLKLWPTLALFGLSLCCIHWLRNDFSPAPAGAPESNISNYA